MAHTRRQQSGKWDKLEREWESRVENARKQNTPRREAPVQVMEPEVDRTPVPTNVLPILQEAEKAIQTQAYSRQNPPGGVSTAGEGLLWWTGGSVDTYIPISNYGMSQRQLDLREFVLVAPMCSIAEAVLIKKMQALQWSVEAGRNRAIHWQRVLTGLEQGQGWDTFVAKWVRSYCESDYGGYAEIIRRAPTWAINREGKLTDRGEAAVMAGKDNLWEIVDAKVFDPCQLIPTDNPEFPLVYYNPYDGSKHRLREHQFMRIQDMPNVDSKIPGQGLCAVSRAVYAAQEDRMATRYGFEAISENPGSGMVLANVNQNLLESALKSAKQERQGRGVVYYKGLIFLPVLDPGGNIKLEYLTFSHLPENFRRGEEYSRIKEVVASAFGMDVLELGSIPGHNLGSAEQATVAAAKSRGKGIGALIQGVEREFRHKFLPGDIQFQIKKHDIDEQKDKAQLDTFYFQHATAMMQAGAWDAMMANQYLADMGAIAPEYPYMLADLTSSEELDDTEASEKRRKRDGTRTRLNRHGYVEWVDPSMMVKRSFAVSKGKLVDSKVKVTEEDIARARARFGRLNPEYAGLVNGQSERHGI